ncbi:MAG: GxxExxY protein [Gemmatimonadales bacterium]
MRPREGGLLEEPLTRSVLGAFFEVYNALGYGFLEHVYVMALERELRARGHAIGREVGVRISYKGEDIASQRLDMVVDEKLILEIKSTYDLPTAARRQLFNYLRASRLEVGLLLHFGPEPKFYRLICTNRVRDGSTDPQDSLHPSHPHPES